MLKKCHVGAEYWSWGLNVEAVVMAERHALSEAFRVVPKDQNGGRQLISELITELITEILRAPRAQTH